MTDDTKALVERLRDKAAVFARGRGGPIAVDLITAADTIEALTARAEKAEAEASRLGVAMKQMREDFRRIQMLSEQHCPVSSECVT